jgi:hypothetical protein
MNVWIKDGKLSREDGPAYVEYKGFIPVVEKWYLHGQLHRTDGYAVIYRNESGEMIHAKSYIHGKKQSTGFIGRLLRECNF